MLSIHNVANILWQDIRTQEEVYEWIYILQNSKVSSLLRNVCNYFTT